MNVYSVLVGNAETNGLEIIATYKDLVAVKGALPDQVQLLIDWDAELVQVSMEIPGKDATKFEYEIYSNDEDLISDLLVTFCHYDLAAALGELNIRHSKIEELTKDIFVQMVQESRELLTQFESPEILMAILRTGMQTTATGPQGQKQFLDHCFKALPLYSEYGIPMDDLTVSVTAQLVNLMRVEDSVRDQILSLLPVK